MYLNFYNLRREPFQITPDPEFLYLSPSHREALGSIKYGIEKRKGFIAIIGEVGVGKTTILRSYLKSADKRKLRIIYLFNANISFSDLLKTIFRELGLEIKGSNAFEMMTKLYEVLIEEYRHDNNIVLAVDEAQNMPVETLENLRMLSNLETSTEKLIQILLIGQPELDEKLNREELRQFKQRIAVRSTINPLTSEESLQYIRHRLLRATGDDTHIFSKNALKLVVKYAKGVPRILNTICSNALITGYAYQQRPIKEATIKEVIRDFEGAKKSSTSPRRWLAYVASIFLFLGLFWSFSYRNWLMTIVRTPSAQSASSTAGTGGYRSDGALNVEMDKHTEAAATTPRPVSTPPASPAVEVSSSDKPESNPVLNEKPSLPKRQDSPASLEGSRPALSASKEPMPDPPAPKPEATPGAQNEAPGSLSKVERSSPDKDATITKPGLKSEVKTKTVKRGDTLTKLMMDVYGSMDNKLMDKVRQNNPQLTDINTIRIGQVLYFPNVAGNTEAKAE